MQTYKGLHSSKTRLLQPATDFKQEVDGLIARFCCKTPKMPQEKPGVSAYPCGCRPAQSNGYISLLKPYTQANSLMQCTLREDGGLDIESPNSSKIFNRASPDRVACIVLRLLKSDFYRNEKCFRTVTSRLDDLQKKTCQV